MERDNVRSYENLCKIFEMRIKLDREKKVNTSEEILANYEKYSKKLDSISNVEFQQKVKPLVKPEASLEKEKDRLKCLVFLLKERLKKRESLEDRYYNTTGRYMRNLQPIVSESELNEKQDRLDLIERYFKNNKEIGDTTASIAKLKNSLEEEEEQKNEYFIKNGIMEKELSKVFLDLVNEDEYYANLDKESIDRELALVFDKVSEAKETLDVTKDSVSSLLTSGNNSEYSSYIDEASKSYYVWKNRELILKIYLLILEPKESFLELYSKRKDIKDIIDVRSSIRSELEIDTQDELSTFEKILLEQIESLEKEKEILENISDYSNKIKLKEEKLEMLEEDNNSVEMLALLREYGIIDVYEVDEDTPSDSALDTLEPLGSDTSEDIPSSDEGPALTLNDIDIPNESVINEVIDPYRIVSINKAPVTLNIGLAKLKGDSIREKVNKKLNPEAKKIKPLEFNIPTQEKVNSLENNKEETSSIWNPTSFSDNSINEVNNISYPSFPSVDDSYDNNNITNKDASSSYIEENNYLQDLTSNKEFSSENTSNIDNSKNNDSLIWQEPTDIIVQPVNPNNQSEIKNNIDVTKTETTNNNDTFWVPVDDGKLETNKFPNINIPIQTNFNETKDNLGFPNIESMKDNYDFSVYGGDK